EGQGVAGDRQLDGEEARVPEDVGIQEAEDVLAEVHNAAVVRGERVGDAVTPGQGGGEVPFPEVGVAGAEGAQGEVDVGVALAEADRRGEGVDRDQVGKLNLVHAAAVGGGGQHALGEGQDRLVQGRHLGVGH